MVEHRRSDPNAGVWRFLEDLRAGLDRRSGRERRTIERRAGSLAVAYDRRVSDRRDADRRRIGERRRHDFASFNEQEAARIREMLTDARTRVICPRCGANLLLTLPVTQSGTSIQAVLCTGCRGRMEM